MSIPSGRAILTTYYSESMYKPLWERYYLPFFDHRDEFVYSYDMKSDYQGRANIMSAKMKHLFEKYALVVVADLDEFIVPDPAKYKDLGDYMDKFDKPGARVVGYNVIEMPGSKHINLDCKITEQRHYWQRDTKYDKPMIFKVPVNFSPGKHECDREFIQDNDLALFHLRDADLLFLVTTCGLERDRKFIDGILSRQLEAVEIPPKWRGAF